MISGKPRLVVRGVGATILGSGGSFVTALLIEDSPGVRVTGFHIRNADDGWARPARPASETVVLD